MSLKQPSSESAEPLFREDIAVDEHRGTVSARIPFRLPSAAASLVPDLALVWGTPASTLFGHGWDCPVPAVRRSGNNGYPAFDDEPGGDRFVMDGAGELEPLLEGTDLAPGGPQSAGSGLPPVAGRRIRGRWRVIRYRPVHGETEGLTERWEHRKSGEVHWRSCSPDGTVSIFGLTAAARITDPDDPGRVSRWLLERRFDTAGNGQIYDYKAEDGAGVDDGRMSESARVGRGAFANRYPKRIRYGNSVPVDLSDGSPAPDTRWHFQVVFDYGEHGGSVLDSSERQQWAVRPDPYSRWEEGFEVRTWRFCRRLLVFHDMSELGEKPFLASQVDFSYNESDPAAACGLKLMHVSCTGYRPGADGGDPVPFRMPRLRFHYTGARPDREWLALSEGLLPGSRPADLFGDGVPGLLRRQGADWFYRRAAAVGEYEEEIALPAIPADHAGLDISDLEGYGRSDLVRRAGIRPGRYPLKRDRSGWGRFREMKRQVSPIPGQHDGWFDFSGSGKADMAASSAGSLSWFESEGEQGYRKARRQTLPGDPRKGPAVVAQAPGNGYLVANLSGSGQDVVMAANGRICYWPHLGHGRYGDRVEMDRSPRLDRFGSWDPARIRFADLNGSGVDDLIYLGEAGVSWWFNESGNAFGLRQELKGVESQSSHHQLDIADLFAEGTPCLLSVSNLPGRSRAPIRYRRLSGRVPAGLLSRIESASGRVTELEYISSSYFWRKDREEGREWDSSAVAHQPVVRRVCRRDLVGGAETVTRYRYRDGFIDDREGRFRGFGLVEIRDADHLEGRGGDEEPYRSAPACRKVWFHDGLPDRELRLPDCWRGDPGADRPDTSVIEFPEGLSPESVSQAWSVLAGRPVREEVYEEAWERVHAASGGEAAGSGDIAGDGASSDPQTSGEERVAGVDNVPLLVREQSWRVAVLSGASDGVRAVCRMRHAGTVTRRYEGEAQDPRTDQELMLHPDPYGYPQLRCEISCPRRRPDKRVPEQSRYRIVAERVQSMHLERERSSEGEESNLIISGEVFYEESFECFEMKPQFGECFSYEEM